MEDKICSQCGEKFTPERTTAQYCSAKCRIKAHRQIIPTTVIATAMSDPRVEKSLKNLGEMQEKMRIKQEAQRWLDTYFGSDDYTDDVRILATKIHMGEGKTK